MPSIRTDRREDPFPSDNNTHSAHLQAQRHLLRHPKVGTLKLGASDFDLWKAYRPTAQPQPHFKTVAGLYATFQRENAKPGKNFEIAFAAMESEQAIRKAMGLARPGDYEPDGPTE